MELTPRQFVAEVTKIFNMPSRGRTAEQRQFLHACGSLYKKNMLARQGGATNASIQTAIRALDDQIVAETGAALEDRAGPEEQLVCAYDHYADELLASLESSMEPTLSAESSALAALLTLGEFKSINGEFGFELYDYKPSGPMQGGMRGGGLVDSLKKLGSTVCGLFTGGVKSADESAGAMVDSVSAKISTPGFFRSISGNIGVASILFAGTRDPVITLAVRIVNQLNSSLDITSYCGNVFLFGTNLASLMASLVTLTPKLVTVIFLWKVVTIVRELLVEVSLSTANNVQGRIPTDEELKSKIKENLPGLYETIVKRVVSAMGKKTTKAVNVGKANAGKVNAGKASAGPVNEALKSANTASDKVVESLSAAAAKRVNSVVVPSEKPSGSASGSASAAGTGLSNNSKGNSEANAKNGNAKANGSTSANSKNATANSKNGNAKTSVEEAASSTVDISTLAAEGSLEVLAAAVEEFSAAEALTQLGAHQPSKRGKRGGRRTKRSKKQNRQTKKRK